MKRRDFLKGLSASIIGCGLSPLKGFAKPYPTQQQIASDSKNGPADLLILNARLIDGTGAAPQESISIRIRDGWISEIGTELYADNESTLDAKGATVLPGLIDSHIHLFWGPGSFLRTCNWFGENGNIDLDCWRESDGQNVLHYLRAYLACGVTTVLDAAAPAAIVKEIRSHIAVGYPGPRILPLGPFAATPGGYANGHAPPIVTADDVKSHFDLLESLETVGAKTSIEKGWSPNSEAPIFPEAIREAFKRESADRRIPTFIHATSESDMRIALEMEPRALMHTLINREEPLTDDFISLMASADTYQQTTLIPMDAELTFWSSERLEDPLLKLVAPAEELARAKNRFLGRAAHRHMFKEVPLFIRRYVTKQLYSEDTYKLYLENSLDAIRRLHNAGVEIVVGSDSLYLENALYAFHGYSTLREIELAGRAGLTPMEAIQAATRVPAEMLGLDGEIGTIEVGKRADLVIVQDDPLEDLENLKSILWTVQNGTAKTPEQWMNDNSTLFE